MYASLGTTSVQRATSCSAISGHVARPGVYEAEFGLTLRDLIELAGGVPGRARRQDRQPRRRGGRLRRAPRRCTCRSPTSTPGSSARRSAPGAVVVFDETTDIARHPAPDRRVLPRRVLRPVRARAGSGRSARRSCWPGSIAGRTLRDRGRRAGAARRPRPGHARRVDLRPRADRQRRRRAAGCASRGCSRDRGPRPGRPTSRATRTPASTRSSSRSRPPARRTFPARRRRGRPRRSS